MKIERLVMLVVLGLISVSGIAADAVSVQGEDSSGFGFVCEFDDAKYLVVSRHTVDGQKRVAAFLADGAELKLGKLDVAKDADLARFEVAADQPAFKLRQGELQKNEPLHLQEPGEAGKELRGRLVAITPERLEISMRTTLKHSGLPVLDANGAVVGVANMEPPKAIPKNWIKQGYQPSSLRRFALKLKNQEWERTSLERLYRHIADRRKAEQVAAGTVPQVAATFRSPSLRVNRQSNDGRMTYFINGTVILGLSGARELKSPVVRIVALLDCNGERHVIEAFSVCPGGNYCSKPLPVWEYGMPERGNTYRTSCDKTVCCIEGLSYCQPVIEASSLKGMEYFDRKTLKAGGIKLASETTVRCDATHPPQIVAYRFECWQNGSLAGCFDSLRPDTLNSKHIPVDWFAAGKYPEIFVYK